MKTYKFILGILVIAIFNGYMGNNVWSFVALALMFLLCQADAKLEMQSIGNPLDSLIAREWDTPEGDEG